MVENERNSIIDSRMIIAAECLANPAFDGTKKDIAQMAGIGETTLYRWLRKPEFIKIVNDLIDKYANAELGMIWKALAKECSKGNVQAMKLYFEVQDKKKKVDNEQDLLQKAKDILGGIDSAID